MSCTDELTDSVNTILQLNTMGQSPPWEADSHSASKEIPRFLYNPKVHYLFTRACQ
jgi:hypothetical protein